MNRKTIMVRQKLCFCLTIIVLFNCCTLKESYYDLLDSLIIDNINLSKDCIVVNDYHNKKLYSFNKNSFLLYTYNLNSKKVDTTNFSKHKDSKFYNIFPVSKDTLILSEFDSILKILTPSSITDIIVQGNPKFNKELLTYSDGFMNKIDMDNNNLRLSNFADWETDYSNKKYRLEADNMPMLSNYKRINNQFFTLNNVLINRPKEYLNTYYYSRNVKYICQNDSLIYCFPKIPKIFINHNKNIYTINIKELNFLNQNQFNQDSFYNINYVMKSFIISSEIVDFRRIENTNKYYLIARCNQKYANENKIKINKMQDTDIKIFFLNENFKILNYLHLKGGLYNCYRTFQFENKLYIQSLKNSNLFYEIPY